MRNSIAKTNFFSRISVFVLVDAIAAIVSSVALLALMGWMFSFPALKSLFLPIDALKASNAFGFVLAGLSLVLLRPACRQKPVARHGAQGCALLVILLGLFTAAEYFTGLEMGVSGLLVKEQNLGLRPLHMSPVSSCLFILVGTALYLMSFVQTTKLAQWMTFPVILTGFLTLVGFFYGTIMQFGIVHYTPVTILSATLFILMGVGLFLRYPQEGLARMVTSNSVGGWIFRRLLPVVIGTPLLIGWLQLHGELNGYYDSSFRIAIMIVVLSFILLVALWHASLALNRFATDRARADMALRDSEESYRLLTENSSSAVASHELVYDENGVAVDYIFLSANPAFETHTGLPVADIIGRRVTEILPGIETTPFLSAYTKVAETGNPTSFEQYAEPLGRYYAISAYSLGKGRFATVFTDITDRKKAEEQQRQREVFLNLLLETVPIPVYYKGKDGRYVLVNKAFETMFWRPKQDIIGKTVFEICPPERAQTYHEDDQALLAKAGMSAYYSHVEDTMGLVHDVIFQKASVTDPKGQVIGVIGAILNISDNKRLEEELRDAKLQLEKVTARSERHSKKKPQGSLDN